MRERSDPLFFGATPPPYHPPHAMHSAKSRLLGAAFRLQWLLDAEDFDRARCIATERAWMGPFDTSTGEENVPSHWADRLHELLDAYSDALAEDPPNPVKARAALEVMATVVDRIR